MKGRTDADRREFQEIRPRRMRFKTLGIPRPTRELPPREAAVSPPRRCCPGAGCRWPICGRCQAKLDGTEATTPWFAFNEGHPLEIQHQVPAAGVLIEARLMLIVEVPPQRRSLAGRLLGTLGRIFKPGAGRGASTAITGNSGSQEGRLPAAQTKN